MTTLRMDAGDWTHHESLPISYGPLLDFPEDPVACMRRLWRQHGDVAALEEEGRKIVFVFSPEWNQHILSDAKTFHSRFFAIRGSKRSSQRRVSSGLLSMNDDTHKTHRRMVMEFFQKKAIAGYHAPISELTTAMVDEWQPGETRDLHHDMNSFMLRVTSAILFGVDQPEMAYRIGEMTDHWVEMNHEAGMGAFISNPALTEKYDNLMSYAEQLEAQVQQMIDYRRESGMLGSDVLSKLILANQHCSEMAQVSTEQLIGHVTLMFAAAHLTTAHSMTWTLFLLSQHPEIAREVLAETQTQVAGEIPTLDEINKLPLMERAIKESMRVLPASSYSQRISQDFVSIGPLRLGAGTPMIFSQFMTHHRPDLYPEPERFLPERWDSINPSPYAYLPFGSGPRMCLGATMAMMIIKTVLPTVIKKYRLSMVPGAEVSGKVISTMLGPTTTVPVTVSEQDGNYETVPVTGNIHEMVTLPSAAIPQRRAA